MSTFTKVIIGFVFIIVIFFAAVIITNKMQNSPAKLAEKTAAEAAEVKKETEKKAEEVLKSATDEDKKKVSKKGDTVTIDYVGISGGEQFQGGTSQDYDLELGSGTFIDGFEDQLIDHKVGDVVEVKVTFPKDYSSPDLAGQDATFVTLIKNIKKK